MSGPAEVACALAPAGGTVIGTGRRPRVIAGAGVAIVAFHVDPPQDPDVECFDEESAVALALPVGTAPATALVTAEAQECSRLGAYRPSIGLLGDDAALVQCKFNDFNLDVGDGPPRPCFQCELRVPESPSDAVSFGFDHPWEGWQPDFAFVGRTVFGAAHRIGGESLERAMVGFVLRDGRAQQVVLENADEDVISYTDPVVRPLDEHRALVEWESLPGHRRHRALLSEGARVGDAGRIEVPTPAPALAVEETRARRNAPPRLTATALGQSIEIAGVTEDVDRFAPTLVEHGGRRWLFFSEGLRDTTKVRLVQLSPSQPRATGPARTISAPDVEAGHASVSTFGDHLVVVWDEHREGRWQVHAAELRCAP